MSLTDPEAGPSRFWERLGETHRRDLEAFGLETVKRHQALRYFTWRWRWRAIRGSEQMRFLLRHSGPAAIARAAATPVDLSDEAWAGVDWPRRDRWLYAFAVRLLWQYAERRGDRRVIALPEPDLGNPLPVRLGGRLISQDLANSALETAAIGRALGGAAPRSILEVGAGYGRTAYALLHRFPGATYTVVDIPPAIEIARWYLTSLFPANRLRFLAPDEAAGLPAGSADLALSISSLQEMTPAQIEGYLALFDRVAAGGRVYLKQWTAWTNPDDNVEARFEAYPVPRRWHQLFQGKARVQTTFTHAAWSVPGPTA